MHALQMNLDAPNHIRGFSLIEVLIALAIFSIGYLAVGAMQINALNKTRNAREMTDAFTVIETQAERLMSMPFYADDNGIDDDGVTIDGNAVDKFDMLPDIAQTTHDPDVLPHMNNDPWTGRYTVRWDVTDNVPIPPIPHGVGGYSPTYDIPQSKTIALWVTPDDDENQVLLRLDFIKVWSTDNKW